jgi:CTP-dependent riboflavin kinase
LPKKAEPTATPAANENPYSATDAALKKLGDIEALIGQITRSSQQTYRVGDAPPQSKDELLNQLNQRQSELQVKALSAAFTETKKLAAQRKADPTKGTYEVATNLDHDWIPRAQFHNESMISFNPNWNRITINSTAIGIKSQTISLNKDSYPLLESKYKADTDYLNSTATGVPVNRRKQIQAVSDRLRVSTADAERYINAAHRFTDEDYTAMRAVDAGKRVYTTEDGNKVNLAPWRESTRDLNEFLEKAPAFSGAIYRGIDNKTAYSRKNLPKMIESLKSAEGYSETRMSSFTSEPAVAQRFAESGGVILEVVNNNRGVSIRNVSVWGLEDEVIVPKKTRYRYVSERKEGDITIYTVEEF